MPSSAAARAVDSGVRFTTPTSSTPGSARNPGTWRARAMPPAPTRPTPIRSVMPHLLGRSAPAAPRAPSRTPGSCRAHRAGRRRTRPGRRRGTAPAGRPRRPGRRCRRPTAEAQVDHGAGDGERRVRGIVGVGHDQGRPGRPKGPWVSSTCHEGSCASTASGMAAGHRREASGAARRRAPGRPGSGRAPCRGARRTPPGAPSARAACPRGRLRRPAASPSAAASPRTGTAAGPAGPGSRLLGCRLAIVGRAQLHGRESRRIRARRASPRVPGG